MLALVTLEIQELSFRPLQQFLDSHPGNDDQIWRSHYIEHSWQPPRPIHPSHRTDEAPCGAKTSTDKGDCCCRILTPHPGANRHFVYRHHACRHYKQQTRNEPSQRRSHFNERTCNLEFLAVKLALLCGDLRPNHKRTRRITKAVLGYFPSWFFVSFVVFFSLSSSLRPPLPVPSA